MLISFIIGMSVGACLGIGLLCVFQRGAASEAMECPYCGLVVKSVLEHFEASCRSKRWESGRGIETCPYCGTSIRDMSEHLRKAHGDLMIGWQKT